ncbi:Glycoside hydrolase family 17 [Dillenia turbinata]|uniref:Glycoside hydrolase family 17 n=1 Tax=Dillenia turbinata TaxID=194707 RepID=A0AAN8V3E7_9MAGN
MERPSSLGSDCTSPQDVINLNQKYKIAKIRLFDPVPEALEALSESGLEITMGVTDQDIPTIAQSQEDARAWFADEFSESVLPAMQFLNGVVRNLD